MTNVVVAEPSRWMTLLPSRETRLTQMTFSPGPPVIVWVGPPSVNRSRLKSLGSPLIAAGVHGFGVWNASHLEMSASNSSTLALAHLMFWLLLVQIAGGGPGSRKTSRVTVPPPDALSRLPAPTQRLP